MSRSLYSTFVTFFCLVGLFAVVQSASAATAAVSWNSIHQTISGFGAGCPWLSDMTDAQADLFFSTTKGAGLSLIRARVPTESAAGTVECGPTMQKAVARGARAWATPWSPPASMKTNNSLSDGGSLKTTSYQAYADYLVQYVKAVKDRYGVTLYGISPQNEPDYAASYDSAVWSGANIRDFIRYNLGPTFSLNNLTTKIIIPDTAVVNGMYLADDTLNDGTAASYVSVVATHNYTYVPATAYPVAQNMGKEFWMSEISDIHDVFDGSITNGLRWAKDMHDWLTIANVNSWDYWWFWTLYNNDNQGLLDYSKKPAKRLWVMGNFSRFVRPGFVRIDATASPESGVYVSAYKEAASGKLVIVAINQNAAYTTLTVQTDAPVSSVVAYRTSATEDLATIATIPINGGTFIAGLQPQSITTFSGGNTVTPPADTVAPSSPSNVLTAVISSSQINLSWNQSTDNVAVAGYNIYRNGIKIGTSISNSYSASSLLPMTTYSFAVSAFDAASNTSGLSPAVSATTLAAPITQDTTPPSTPTNVNASGVSQSAATISWNASTDNVKVIGYNVYRNGVKIGTSQITNYLDSNLSPATSYLYAIAAFDAAGNTSSQSNPISLTTQTNQTTPPLSFAIGNRVKTTDALKARRSADINARIRCTESLGGIGTITEGPIASQGYTWWWVVYDDGCEGWSADSFLTLLTSDQNPQVPFVIGATVQATERLKVRSSADITAGVVCTVRSGTQGVITEGPTVSGYTWWSVDYQGGCKGWSAQNYLKVIGQVLGESSAPLIEQLKLQIQALLERVRSLEEMQPAAASRARR